MTPMSQQEKHAVEEEEQEVPAGFATPGVETSSANYP